MVDPSKLKKLKIVLEKDDDLLSIEKIEELIKREKEESLKNFFIGLKHIIERHYTEAIKWFQLSDCRDSTALIALLAFKVGDMFLYEEYSQETAEEDCLKKQNISVYLTVDSRKIPFSIKEIKKLPEYI
ncbi:hypothetical protein [Persephonella sp.]|jgi:hypothetical protein